ncbi:glycosyltransferase family 2 protein [Marimonas lutisalis]|uniref:glycosyltransferase family 2 protein n=1 Tax=Marimonas lutisalis TaxID=2545756 RepID=UPI0010F86964|nr:glycosyltransferase [Marimonas lutisalis]
MQHARHIAGAPQAGEDLGRFLQASGTLTAGTLLSVRALQAQCRTSIDRILISEGLLSPDEVATALSRFHGVPRADLSALPPDPELAGLIPLRLCLNNSAVPWRVDGERVQIAVSRPEDFARVLSFMDDAAPRAEMVIATASEIHAALARLHREKLTATASARVPESESCRGWERAGRARLGLTITLLAALFALTVFFPTHVFAALASWAAFTLLVAAGLRLSAYIAHVSRPPETPSPDLDPAKHPLPRVSVLVPLFKETEIAGALVQRLSRLTYPKPLLDIVLVLEENDHLTRETIASCTLPPWMRVIEVPEGRPKTKPRAMNYALDFCDGDIVGIWDAEDAPDPDQVNRVVQEFRRSPPDVVCLQGVLDYYNSRQNWLARCFTIEYAAWFRLLLPGMSRMGLSIPLGGTTLWFDRTVLEELGGWDAHNVTEDADLGFRLARHGYKTRVIETATGEEANCRVWPWVRQRSRWLKGYMVTYLVHMRDPLLFYRQMGPLKFWGFQAHFIAALSQFMLAPILWSFWLVLLGLPHPLDPFVSRAFLINLGIIFLMVEMLSILINATAVSGARHRHLLAWVPTMHFYFPLGAIAAYKALYGLIARPFFWDKTQHGHSLAHQEHASGVGSVGVQLQSGDESL